MESLTLEGGTGWLYFTDQLVINLIYAPNPVKPQGKITP